MRLHSPGAPRLHAWLLTRKLTTRIKIDPQAPGRARFGRSEKTSTQNPRNGRRWWSGRINHVGNEPKKKIMDLRQKEHGIRILVKDLTALISSERLIGLEQAKNQSLTGCSCEEAPR
ncbi:hypothetical protein RRG08_013871 [Elysia crispata]|uniref:Uncharacterized protein n=1 Tax=Elysia crispata TaxID=231223 RepID=A0AAE1D167_9GAST|nr:hypothetical protein RRG08_013871 [Elysia crispata]